MAQRDVAQISGTTAEYDEREGKQNRQQATRSPLPFHHVAASSLVSVCVGLRRMSQLAG
jgi:hypothetical protein